MCMLQLYMSPQQAAAAAAAASHNLGTVYTPVGHTGRHRLV
jgi:hypothetical protein